MVSHAKNGTAPYPEKTKTFSADEKSLNQRIVPRIFIDGEKLVIIAPAFPEDAKKAIPFLMKNVHDTGTVVKWSAAYRLTEIAKHHPKTRKEQIPFFEKVIKKETNNSVKNVYIKAMKSIEKQSQEK